VTKSIVSGPLIRKDAGPAAWVRLAAVFTAALLIRPACFTGLVASDDLGYARYARQISEGSYRLYPHHYAIQYGVIVPLAALYRRFGVQERTTVGFPLLSSSLAAVRGWTEQTR